MRTLLIGACVSTTIAAVAGAQPCLGLRSLGDLIDVTPGIGANVNHVAAAYSATSDRYLVVFTVSLGSPNFNDIFNQVLDGNGGLIGDQKPVVEQEESQAEPAVVWNSVANEFLVA